MTFSKMLAIVFFFLAVSAPVVIRAADDVCKDCVEESVPPVVHPEECWDHAHGQEEAPTGYRPSCAYLFCEDDQMVVMVRGPPELQHIRLDVVKLGTNQQGQVVVAQKCENAQAKRTTGWPAALLNFPALSGVPGIGDPFLEPLPDINDDYWDQQHAFLYNARSAADGARNDGTQTTHPGGVVNVPRNSACGKGASVTCPKEYNLQEAVVDVKEYLGVSGNPDIEIVTRKRLHLRCKAQIVQPSPQSFTPTPKTLSTHTCRQTAYQITGRANGDLEQYEITVRENDHVTRDPQVGWFVNSLTMGLLPNDKIIDNAQVTPVGVEIGTSPAKQNAWTPAITAYSWTTDIVVVPSTLGVDLESSSLYCVDNPVGDYELCDVQLCSAV